MSRLRFFCAPDDQRAQALAAMLAQETDAEIVQSPRLQPTLWVDGRIYYGLERVQKVLAEVGSAWQEPQTT